MEYKGTNLAGYQFQRNARSVQAALERAVLLATGEAVPVLASGRTDSGVHAIAQVAHFDTSCTIPSEKMALALNSFLPPDIRVRESREAPPDFHSRYSAKRKTYLYKMYRARIPSPLRDELYAMILPDTDVSRMRRGAAYLLGEHDFAGFQAVGSVVASTVRTIYAADFNEQGDEVYFSVTGNGFLYKMVRIIVGTLLDVGAGKREPEEIREILLQKGQVQGGPTAPPQGLYLYKVEYDCTR